MTQQTPKCLFVVAWFIMSLVGCAHGDDCTLSRDEAIASIEKAGGVVRSTASFSTLLAKTKGGVDMAIWTVQFEKPIDDAVLLRLIPSIMALPNCELVIVEPTITTKGLGSLNELDNLRVLVISGPRIGDDEAKVISENAHLELLVMANMPLTNTGLSYLSKLKRLRMLLITETKTTIAGVNRLLDASPNLEMVERDNVAIMNARLNEEPSR